MTNSRTTRKALLSSALALLMCVAMLIATTFAWFTDTASTGVNKIVSGNLKVDIIGADSEDHIEKLNFTKAATADEEAGAEILWEPGCRYLTEGFRIANKGNLALKWKAQVNTNNIVDGKSLLDVIDFYVVTKADDGTETAVAVENFIGNLDKGAKSDVYYIKGVMQTSAGNDYQDLTLEGITITVYATQDTVENDSFDNQYDKDATYSVTAQQWAANFTNGATVTVSSPTAIDGKADDSGVIDSNSEPNLSNAGEVALELKNTVTSGNLSGNTWGVMRVMSGTTLVISGDENGKFINTKSNSIINVCGGNVVVNSGYFESNSDIFFYYTDSDGAISSMSLTINGGTFKAEENVIDNPANLSTSNIKINGGTFYGWDPNAYVDDSHTVTTSSEGDITVYTVTAN